MRYSLIIFLLIFSAFETPKLVKTKVAEGITASIPVSFKPMDDLDFTQRYPSVRAPLAAYTNADREVDFSINISATQWPDGDLDVASKFFKVGLSNLYDKVDIISEGVHEIHGKKFIYFEIESRINAVKNNEAQRSPVLNYTYIQYLVEKKRTLVFSFNCPARLKQDWQETAQTVMKSIRVK
jgi:hypothetical protein